MIVRPVGDCAVVLSINAGLDEPMLDQVRAVAKAIDKDRPKGITDISAAFGSVTVFYNPAQVASFVALCDALRNCVDSSESKTSEVGPRMLEIPVCYGGSFGPDLTEVAANCRLTPDEVMMLHTGGCYFVQATGFAPGFAYLGGLSSTIHTPRRATPRSQVPAGAVGIGGSLTGVYPLVTPGGWNLIGRTPLKMFDPTQPEPALLVTGDRVRFRAISQEEFVAWK